MSDSQIPAATQGLGSVYPPTPPMSQAPQSLSVPAGRNVVVVATHNQPPQGRSVLPFVTAPDSQLAAGFRVLAHRLKGVDNPRTIAISSPMRDEGKTTLAINLAMALAEHGRDKVLLVEANLRHPRVGEALGFAPPNCFGEQMVRYLDLPGEPWRVVAAFFDNLHVLAVHPRSKGTWLLNAPAFRAAMAQLKEAPYAHIIVDCPGALGTADVNIIEDTTDGVILTAMAGMTKGAHLIRTQEHLAPANILGTVLMNGRYD
ncbi:MAG: CpsD/CapB family tyrosine-protein kinase [Polyangiaceae bacterium]